MHKRQLWLRMEAFNNMASQLIPKLSEAIGKLRNTKVTSADIEKAELSQIIRLYTGISATVYIADIGVNAFYRIPQVDNNHPFFKQLNLKQYFGSETGSTLLGGKGPVTGDIDYKNYKVSGVYSNIPVSIMVGAPLLTSTKFTDTGIATILAHELGHAFDYFDKLGNLVRDSWVTSAAARAVVGAAPMEEKKRTLVKAKEALDLEDLDIQALLHGDDLTKKETVEAVLITNSYVKGATVSPTTMYDYRTIEQNADAFVIAHGGGREYAKAMATMYQVTGNIATRSAAVYTAAELFKVVLFLIFLFGVPFFTILWLLRMTPATKMYDDPHQRVLAFKQQLIGYLRDAKDDEEKASLASEIESIEVVLQEITKRKSVFTLAYNQMYSAGRKLKKEELYVEALRELIFNELQLKATQLRNV